MEANETPKAPSEREIYLESVTAKLKQMLSVNDIKKGSVKAKMLEHGFLQGLMHGQTPVDAYLAMTVISGRSILD